MMKSIVVLAFVFVIVVPNMYGSNIIFSEEDRQRNSSNQNDQRKEEYNCGVNKNKVKPFPWVVDLVHNKKKICTGSLIHPQVVLTTAQCVSSTNKTKAYVKSSSNSNSNVIEVKGIYTDMFGGNHMLSADIALLKLNKPFKLTDNLNVVCLPNNILFPISTEIFGSFQGSSLKIIENKMCDKIKNNIGLDTQNFYCTDKEKHKGTPIVYAKNTTNNLRYVQIGIFSDRVLRFGNIKGLLTNVTNKMDWINKTMSSICHGSKNYSIPNKKLN